MRPREAARAWADAWIDGWPRHDPDVIAARYAESCRFLSQPFRDLGTGREAARAYVRQAFGDERSSLVAFMDPIVDEDGRAAVEYRAVITTQNGAVETLAGTTILRFDALGLVTEHRDYWATSPGDRGLAFAGLEPKEASR